LGRLLVDERGDEVSRPADLTVIEPGGEEAVASMFGDDAAQSASATSDKPSSNSRLPRRDWQ